MFEKKYKNALLKMIEEEELREFQKSIHDFNIEKFMMSRLKCMNIILVNILWIPMTRKPLRYLIVLISLSFFVYKIPYFKVKRKIKKMIDEIEMSFPIWIRQLQILLQSNTVVVSLNKSLKTTPELMKKELEILIDHLEAEPLCYQYYAEFLNQYELVQISRAMKCLYRCSIEGKKSSYRELEQLSHSTSSWIRNKRKSRKETQLLIYQWWGIVPLIGVTIVFLVIMINVIGNLMGKEVMM